MRGLETLQLKDVNDIYYDKLIHLWVLLNECETLVSTAHVSDVVQVEGMVPRDREAIVCYLDRAIAELDEDSLARYRRSVRSL